MRTLSSNKSIKSMERKPTRKFKPLPLLNTPHSLSFSDVSELIFKAQIIPVVLELETSSKQQLTFMMTATHASLKNGQETASIPFSLAKSRWLRIVLGNQIKKLNLKSTYHENKIDKNQIYQELAQWKNHTGSDMSACNNFFLQPLVKLLKGKAEKKQTQNSQRSSLGAFVKTRFSQRHVIRPQIGQFRNKYESQLDTAYADNSTEKKDSIERKDNKTFHVKKEVRKGSSTLETDKIKGNHGSYMKESGASTSISNEPEIRFPKRMRKFRQFIEHKAAKSQKEVIFDHQVSQILPPKPKAAFYKNFNISQEEIDLKRKKFDSQFIEKSAPKTTKEICHQKNDSEVVEDICKVETSQGLGLAQDTFQRGFVDNKLTNKEIDESGTLYQSVYE